MARAEILSPECLRQLLRYEPETGKLFWRARSAKWFVRSCMAPSWNAQHADKEALFTLNDKGYRYGCIMERHYRAHRVIIAMMTDSWPDEVDHQNGNRADNRWENLRAVGDYEQARNKKLRADNSSGHVGVCFHSASGKWMAREGDRYLGIYPTIEAAIAARVAASGDYHPNHGKVRP